MREKRLPLKLLKTDFSYQSPVKNSQVVKIVKDFDPRALHTIVVSEREDGTYYIIDGQHRVVALMRLGYDLIRCTVHTGLSIDDEAKMYHDLNDRPKKSPGSKGKARLAFNDPQAVELDNLVKSIGMFIEYDHTGHKNNCISAYGTLERLFKKEGYEHLKVVLLIIKNAFGTNSQYFQSDIMNGFSKFVKTYHEDLDYKWLVEKLSKTGFVDFMEKVDSEKYKFASKKECLPYVVTDIYNFNKKKDQLEKKLLLF